MSGLLDAEAFRRTPAPTSQRALGTNRDTDLSASAKHLHDILFHAYAGPAPPGGEPARAAGRIATNTSRQSRSGCARDRGAEPVR